MSRLLLCVPVLLLALAAVTTAQPPTDTDQAAARLLSRHCLECHSGTKPRGGLDLTSRAKALAGGQSGPALVPGKSRDSLLWQHVDDGEMPPKKPLSAADKKLLRQWLDAGATWAVDPLDPFQYTTDVRAGYDWWSLQPVVRPPLPVVKQTVWPRNAVDYFVLERLETHQLAPSPEASRATLIRRLYFDLLGLPPSPEDVKAFVGDPAPDAYERLVEGLLASPHYGERWARHWLDVVRFGESNGFEFDELRPNAWPYRDWVVQALNDDMPFDRFARMQLAGDVLAPTDPAAVAATGFLVAGAYDTVGQQQQSVAMKKVVRQDELEDLAATVGQTFLGLTVHCARCHDHKFDPIRQKEYYQLTAALGGVYHGQRPLPATTADKELVAIHKQRLAELDAVRAALAKLEEPVRQAILAERKKGQPAPPPADALARWDFTRGTDDLVGKLPAKLHGNAAVSPAGLAVGGTGDFASTAPLPKVVKARTLAAVVQLADLTQRGGGVVGVQTLDGQVFDTVVFGEQQPGQWMAGSDFFRRTKPFGAAAETTAHQAPAHLAITYAEDGTITAYRNGKLHGAPYQAGGVVTFEAGKSQVIFGVRHTPAAAGKLLKGMIREAALFDRALSPAEVAALAGTISELIPDQEITARLDAAGQAERGKLLARIQQLATLVKTPPTPRLVYAVAPREAGVAHLLHRGNPATPGEVVKPGGVAALRGPDTTWGRAADAPDAERRRKLAEWITHPKNPLFARVIVNRLWQHHFGAGIVETPNDFGFNGGRPSHPLVLDWLADELVRQNYSLKALHRLLVTSATYRQSSHFRPDAAKVDAGNRFLWRKSLVRLEAEAVRDSILAVAGQLNLAMGGPGMRDFTFTVRGATYFYEPLEGVGWPLQKRSLYRTWARSGRNALLDVLDCPDPSTATHKRAVTTTPLQALTLMNGAFVLRMAEQFAERVRQEAGDDVAAQVERAWWLAYGRPPTAQEIGLARPVVQQHGLFVLCRALFNSNEFVYVD
jgi:hypothetical protein